MIRLGPFWSWACRKGSIWEEMNEDQAGPEAVITASRWAQVTTNVQWRSIHATHTVAQTISWAGEVSGRCSHWKRKEKCMYNSTYLHNSAQTVSCVWLFVTPWTVACQDLLSMEFSRQEYWNGLPCTPPGDLPNPGIKPRDQTQVSHIAGRFLTIWVTREAVINLNICGEQINVGNLNITMKYI